MRSINLLPWREWLAKRRRRYCVVLTIWLLLAVITSLGLMSGWLGYRLILLHNSRVEIAAKTTALDNRYQQYLQLKRVCQKITKLNTTIAELRARQQLRGVLLGEIVALIPRGVVIHGFKLIADRIFIIGSTENQQALTTMLQRLHEAPLLQNVTMPEQINHDFAIICMLKK